MNTPTHAEPIPGRPRLLIADGHRMVVEAFTRVLSDEFQVVGVAFDGPKALARVESMEAECLLLELQLPGQNGLELIPRVRRLRPRLKILVVTMYLDRGLANAALSAGANGFVVKDATMTEMIDAIREVLEGRRYVSPRLPKISHRVGMGAYHPALAQLTARQQEIMQSLGEGKRGAAIARDLGLGSSAVYLHKRNIMKRLGIDHEWALLRFAMLTCSVRQHRSLQGTTVQAGLGEAP